jgi:hypothetical protein
VSISIPGSPFIVFFVLRIHCHVILSCFLYIRLLLWVLRHWYLRSLLLQDNSERRYTQIESKTKL